MPKTHQFFSLCAFLASLISLHAYDIPGFTPDQIVAYKQTVNSSSDPVTLNLHVFTQEGHQASDSRPAMVFFFGGGWVDGSPSHFHPHCEYLASRGMVAISAEYRVKNQHGTTPQECVKDGKSAIRYVREHAAELGIDPNRIAAGGGSAGGHVAAAAGTLTAYEEAGENLAISSKPDALVLYNPVIDNGPGGYGYSTVQAYWQTISPLSNIDATAPPTVFFLGTNDNLIPVATGESYKALMDSQGIRCDFHLYEGQPHSFFNFDVMGDSSGPFYGYQDTLFKTDEFLVSLGYLTHPHETPVPVVDWVTIFGDAGFSGGTAGGNAPTTTDADADSLAANFSPITLDDGAFVRLKGTVTVDAALTGGDFRFGLFDGDNPVLAGDGTGYTGIWASAPATSDTEIAVGDGSGASNPFESASSTTLGPIPAADITVPANAPVDFTLMVSRNGNRLDISVSFTDRGSYNTSQNLLNQTVTNYTFDSVAFLMTGDLNATQASFVNIEIETGAMLPTADPDIPASGVITYVDAVEGSLGNTFQTGSPASDISWVGPDATANSTTQWNKRAFANNNTIFEGQADGAGKPPELITQIIGLTDGTYTIWAFYWDQVDSDSQNWILSTGLTPGSLTTYSSPGEPAVAGATTTGVVAASSLNFVTTPDTSEPSRAMFGVNLGEVEVSAGSVVNVYVGNDISSSNANRAWFDGIGYQIAEPPVNEVTYTSVLGVDFNRNDAFASPSQSGYRIISGSHTQTENLSSYTKSIGYYGVTVSQTDGEKLEFRGANSDSTRAIPGGDTSMSFLVSDFVATREGAIDIQISGLAAGDYLFRSWHLDTFTGSALGFAQGANSTTPNTIEGRIGGILKDSVQPTALGSAGLNTTFIDDIQIPSLEFAFTHDGISPLSIELRSTTSNGSDQFLLLNGFEILSATP